MTTQETEREQIYRLMYLTEWIPLVLTKERMAALALACEDEEHWC